MQPTQLSTSPGRGHSRALPQSPSLDSRRSLLHSEQPPATTSSIRILRLRGFRIEKVQVAARGPSFLGSVPYSFSS